jgi:molybdate transport system regulatory protein
LIPSRFLIKLNNKEVEISQKALELLANIKYSGSITKAAKNVGISYRTAMWHIRKMENLTGKKVVITRRGRVSSGSKLTEFGEELINEYFSIIETPKLSARNKLEGMIVKIQREGIIAKVVVHVKESLVTAVITNDSVINMELKEGDKVNLLIKATSIILTK